MKSKFYCLGFHFLLMYAKYFLVIEPLYMCLDYSCCCVAVNSAFAQITDEI